MQNSSAVSYAAPGHAVSYADVSDLVQLRKRARAARAADRACKEPGGPLRVFFERCHEGCCAGVAVRVGERPMQGCHPQGLAIRLALRPRCRVNLAVGQAFHGRPCHLKPRPRRVFLAHWGCWGNYIVADSNNPCLFRL